MKKINYGLRGHDIADNFSDMCKKAKEQKINILQFAFAKTCNNIDFDAIGYDENIAASILKELKEYMLEVAVLGCYINPVEIEEKSKQIQLKRFENFINYSKDFNAGVIGTETGWKSSLEETHSENTYKEFLNSMAPLVNVAENKGVQIGIEPVWQLTIYSVDMMEKMLKDMASDNISVILDVSNLLYSGNLNEQDFIINSAFDKFGDRISTIHLKDYYVVEGRKSFAPAGLGKLNIELLFKNVSQMKNKPDIILDELPVDLYKETVKRLDDMLY